MPVELSVNEGAAACGDPLCEPLLDLGYEALDLGAAEKVQCGWGLRCDLRGGRETEPD